MKKYPSLVTHVIYASIPCTLIVAYISSLARIGVYGYMLVVPFSAWLAQLFRFVVNRSADNKPRFWYEFFKDAPTIYFWASIVVWVNGWAWAGWTWRSLVVAVISYSLVSFAGYCYLNPYKQV